MFKWPQNVLYNEPDDEPDDEPLHKERMKSCGMPLYWWEKEDSWQILWQDLEV